MTINLIIGLAGRGALGVERYERGIEDAIHRADDLRLRRVAMRWPFPKRPLPALYSVFPIYTWLATRTGDINHLTNSFFAHILNWGRLPRTIVTCLDLIPYEQLESREVQYTPYLAQHVRLAVRGMLKADHIVTGSDYIRQRIIALFAFPEDRITVIPLTVDLERYKPGLVRPDILTKYGLSSVRRYVLYVGSDQRRKNLPRLVEAFAGIASEFPDLDLIKVGRSQDAEGYIKLLRTIQCLGLENRIHLLDHVNECDLPDLYRGATAFVFPSLSEGFGLPPLEALACGIPVVCSDATSLPEVVGDAGLLVNAREVADIQGRLYQVLSDGQLARSLSVRGPAQARRFNHEVMATKLHAIYTNMAAG